MDKRTNFELARTVRDTLHLLDDAQAKEWAEGVKALTELERRLSSSLADRLARVEEDLLKFRAEHRAEIERNPYGDGYAKASDRVMRTSTNDAWQDFDISWCWTTGRPTDREIFDAGWDARKRSEFKRAACEPDADEIAWQKLSAWNKRRFGEQAAPVDVEIIGPFVGDKPFYYARLSDGRAAKGATRSEALQAAAEYAENQCRPVGTGAK